VTLELEAGFRSGCSQGRLQLCGDDLQTVRVDVLEEVPLNPVGIALASGCRGRAWAKRRS
jgi:hypothetical protein